MHRTQIALCYGTRPQVIKSSALRSSTLGCALAATKLGIPLVHVEAGGHPASLCDAVR